MHKAVYFSDEALLAGIRNEDEAALSYLYKDHFPMILHFVQNNNGSDDEAKDIYQEAVIARLRHICILFAAAYGSNDWH